MKKLISTLAIIIALCSLNACNEANKPSDVSVPDSSQITDTSKPDNKKPEIKDVKIADVEKALAEALGDGYLCTADIPDDELMMSCIGRLNTDNIEEYIAKKPEIFAQDAVYIIKCKQGYADEAVTIFNEYFAQCISYIRQYTFDVAKVKGTRIYRFGDIIMYITAGAAYTGSDPEAEAKLAADEYKKIDNAIKELFGETPENLAVMPEEDDKKGGFDFNDYINDSDFVIGG